MSTYEYRCSWCGPFETRANSGAAGSPALCPECGALSPRTFSAPGGRSPRRAQALEGVGRPGRERIDRAREGVPRAGGLPRGRQLRDGLPLPAQPRAGSGRPWQIGH